MGKFERVIATLAALVTIPTFAFFVYDRFWGGGSGASMTPALVQPAGTPSATSPSSTVTPSGPPIVVTGNGSTSPAPSKPAPSTQAASATPAPTAATSLVKLIFLCRGAQSPTFTPGRSSNPALERFKNVPQSVEAIFDFSYARQSGAAEVLVEGKTLEWTAYTVAVELAGPWGRYGAMGTNTQSNAITFLERGEVNFETLEWSSDRVIRTAAPRGPQTEIKVTGKCEPLDSPKPKPSDAHPQWLIEAKLNPASK